MTTVLKTLQQRLDHAWAVREAYYAESHAFIDERPWRIWAAADDATGGQVLMIEPTRPVPPRLGFLFADCVHNVRATLDNLIWHIAVREGLRNVDQVSFPVATTAEQLQAQLKRKKMQGLSTDVLAAIEEFQTYQQPRPVQTPEERMDRLVWESLEVDLVTLDRLWNDDKHRATRLVLAQIDESTFEVDGNTGPSDVLLGPIVDRSVLARAAPRTAISSASLGVVVALNATGPLGGYRADVVLTDLYLLVAERVVPRFARFLC